MDIRIEIGPWTLSAGLWQTRDLEDELEAEDDPDPGGTRAGAADRGLDLSTDRADTPAQPYDVGIDRYEDSSRRTGFA